MIELNLLPDIKQEFVHAKRQKRVVIVAMILTSAASIGLVALLAFYAYIAQPVRQNIADSNISKLDKDLNKKKDLVRNLTIQNQLKSINELHETKGVYGRLFGYLKSLNPEAPNNVSISKATVDTIEGTILIEASAKDYPAVVVFKDTLENAKIEYIDPQGDSKKKQTTRLFPEVTVSDPGITQNNTGQQVTAFKVTLLYEPLAFDWTLKDPTIKIPKQKTNQSANRVSVFSNAPVQKEEEE